MRTAKFGKTVGTGLILGLLAGWLFTVSIPALAEGCDMSWCLAQHEGTFEGDHLIWPGTADGRFALVTVRAIGPYQEELVGYPFPILFTVYWKDIDGNRTVDLRYPGDSVTVWAQSVWVLTDWDSVPETLGDTGISDKNWPEEWMWGVHRRLPDGNYTITFNLCGS